MKIDAVSLYYVLKKDGVSPTTQMEGWIDTFTNFLMIPQIDNLPYKHIASATKDVTIPTCIHNNELWIKIYRIPINGSIVVKVIDSGNGTNDPESVFEFFDYFDETELDTTKWIIQNPSAGTISISNSNLIIKSNGDNWNTNDTSLLVISKNNFGSKYIVETYVSNVSWDSYQRIFGVRSSQNTNAAIFVTLCDYFKTHITNVWRSSTGASAGYFGNGSGLPNPSPPYVLGIEVNGKTVKSFIKVRTKEYINTQTLNEVPSYVYLTDTSSMSNYPEFDWVRVRKFAEQDPIVEVTNTSTDANGNTVYEITVSNPNDYDLYDFQIKLPITVTNGTPVVKQTIETPTLWLPYYPAGQDKISTFTTQFNHNCKVNSPVHFHIHTLIPEPITEDKTVKMRFHYAILEPCGAINDTESHGTSKSMINNTIEKEFIIPAGTYGHWILDFGEIFTYPDAVSVMTVCNLERVGTEDTFGDLLVAYCDFHYIADTLGSQTEYHKYLVIL